MAERIDLIAPYPPAPPTVADMQIVFVMLHWEDKRITIQIGKNGVKRDFIYEGDDATAKMIALNKANLSVKSLHKRIFEMLIADGHISGTIAGTVD